MSWKVQQVPDLNGMNLHWRGRQQNQSFGAFFQTLHQLEKRVGPAFPLAARGAPPGMVGLVEYHEVPRFGLLQKG